MPLSPFFLHGSPSEQRLVQDLVNEHLKMFGQDVLYLPRKIINEATVIKEINASRFDDSFRIEAYLTNFEGFGTPSDILTKFGVRATDEIQLVISLARQLGCSICLFVRYLITGKRGQIVWLLFA